MRVRKIKKPSSHRRRVQFPLADIISNCYTSVGIFCISNKNVTVMTYTTIDSLLQRVKGDWVKTVRADTTPRISLIVSR